MAGRGVELVFAPLGGVGEIGMNLALYGLGDERNRKWIAVDLGVAFAGDDLPGIDLIFPDIRFIIEQRRNVLGIVLTHAHEDHFGALLDLWPRLRLPIYATPFTAALLEAKRQGEPGAPDIPVNVIALNSRFTLGPFDIELVTMAHSIPESNGLIIRTPLGTVLHTGDWKIDPTPIIGSPTDDGLGAGRETAAINGGWFRTRSRLMPAETNSSGAPITAAKPSPSPSPPPGVPRLGPQVDLFRFNSLMIFSGSSAVKNPSPLTS